MMSHFTKEQKYTITCMIQAGQRGLFDKKKSSPFACCFKNNIYLCTA